MPAIQIFRMSSFFALLEPASSGLVSAGQVHWMTVVFMLVLYTSLLGGTVFTLRRDGSWSLSSALSENGEPSTSRLIAFLGLQVMLVLYIGVGNIMIYRMLRGDAVDLPSFFLMGLGLFAPYAVSQFREAITGLTNNAIASPAGGMTVTAIQPTSLKANTKTQVTLSGTGFTADTKVMLTTASGGPLPVAIDAVSADRLTFTVIFPATAAAFNSSVAVSNSIVKQQTSLRVEP